MTKIVNAAVNDSGKYKVKAVFSDMHDNTEKVKCLQVHHLNVSGQVSGHWCCYFFAVLCFRSFKIYFKNIKYLHSVQLTETTSVFKATVFLVP